MAMDSSKTIIYTCPMHPDVRKVGPGSCPICGMDLEPEDSREIKEEQTELRDMVSRFWISTFFSIPLLLYNMGGHFFLSAGWHSFLSRAQMDWVQFMVSTPVVLWGGWPFWQKAWLSLKNVHFNMFTLIALGVGVAYFYSFGLLLLSYFGSALFGDSQFLHVYFEPAAVITTLVLLGQVLELKARSKTSQAVRQLLELTPEEANIINPDGREVSVPLKDVKVGYLLRIKPGDKIPVDGVLIDGESSVDQSMITGESIPLEKTVGDKIIAGTLNIHGSFIMRAEQVGHETVLSQIVEMVSKAQRSRAPVHRLVDQISAIFVPIIMGISLLTAVVWYVYGPEPQVSYALMTSIAVLIIACPCALGLATPMSIMVGIGRGAQEGILIKDAAALEILTKVDTVVVDKTGTLTEGKPNVVDIVSLSEYSRDTLLQYAATLEIGSEHPLARAITKAAQEKNISLKEIKSFKAIPGRGVQAIIDNIPMALGNEAFMQSLGIDVSAVREKTAPYRQSGKGIMLLSLNNILAGFIVVADTLKETTKPVIKNLVNADIEVVMLTGDNRITAEAIALELGIRTIKADVLPAEKYDFIRSLQDQHKVVAMVGDGVNDAPALTQADIGVAMGTGANVAMESAGLTLMSGNLQGFIKAHHLSMLTMKNIRQNLVLAFGYNILAIPVAAGVLYPQLGILLTPVIASVAMALSSVSVILNALRLRGEKIKGEEP